VVQPKIGLIKIDGLIMEKKCSATFATGKSKLSNFALALVMLVISQTSIAQVADEGNRIKNLSTGPEIEKFIHSLGNRFVRFKINDSIKFWSAPCNELRDSLKITSAWIKADFDNNGLTDLLVIGKFSDHEILCILDFGQGKYDAKWLTKGEFEQCTFPKLRSSGDTILVDYFCFVQYDWRVQKRMPKVELKTLIYKFDDFVEFNQSPKKVDIKKIQLSTTSCFGTCPEFDLMINNDRSAEFNAIAYNKKNGKFKTVVNEKDYQNLIDLLNYIDFQNLKDSYSVSWSDAQTCVLAVSYNNGRKKVIKDYGRLGTFGLSRLYAMLFALRDSQEWR
jgi:hypothetical protein